MSGWPRSAASITSAGAPKPPPTSAPTRKKNMESVAHIKALDLFAGTGWGVACQRLGIKEAGVEIMPEAIATRTANGMETIYHDVWDGLQLTAEMHRQRYGSYGLLIASPPCQTFSMAGNGAGRAAMDEVLEAIALHAYKDPDALLRFGEQHDMRTALVLTPLAYVWRDRPRLVALEQVPTVLPVWEAVADVMRAIGYDVKVEILNAEQYGVPQTRRRAILVARRGGPVSLPVPTHSRYYTRNPEKLDPGVKKWVSMAEALGWAREGVTFTQNNKQAHQAHRAMSQPAPTITAGHDSGNRGFIDGDDFTVATPDEVAALQSYPAVVYRNGNQANAARRTPDQPAPTLLFGHNSNKVEWMHPDQAADPSASGVRVSVEEAAALQTYPASLRSNYGTGGDPANRGERTADQPAPTLTGKADRNKWDGERNMTAEEAAALQTYPTGEGWGFTDRPALTVTGHGIVTRHPTGQQRAVFAAVEKGTFAFKPPYTAATAEKDPTEPISLSRRFHGGAVNVSVEEAATLQSYPTPPFVWCGTKTKQFLQIGNAVPPLLAQHVLAALVGFTPGR